MPKKSLFISNGMKRKDPLDYFTRFKSHRVFKVFIFYFFILFYELSFNEQVN